MLRVIVKQARPGMVLARAVINPRQPDTTLLASGYALEPHTIARLHEIGVYEIWINYPGLDFLDDLYSPRLTQQQQRMCETLKTSFTGQATRTDAKLPILQYRDVVQELVQSILDSAHDMPFMSDLAGVDDYLLRHSADVCFLGVMLGLRLESYLIDQRRKVSGRHAKDVVNLGIGCMLHDIGELQMPESQRESRRAIDDGNTDWHKHAELGYATVRGQIEPSAANVVLNHHQHYDGTGFPKLSAAERPQAGAQIHVFSRIAMAADVYQHLLRGDGVPMPAVAALWRIQQAPLRSWFDPIVLAALLAVVPPFLPGMVVQLSDRRFAVVAKNHAEAPCYPEVQVLQTPELESPDNQTSDREVIDLSKEPKLQIAAVDGCDVTQFLFGSRRLTPAIATPLKLAV